MYNFRFVRDDFAVFHVGAAYGVYADADFGSAPTLDIATSQGFNQVGVTAEKTAIGARYIQIKGVVRGDIPRQKRAMRRAIPPLARGWLVFQDWVIRVVVQNPPSFATERRNGSFLLRFLAPYPFFQSKRINTVQIGRIDKKFSFPVNYATPHQFGVLSGDRQVYIYNDSDVDVQFTLTIKAVGASTGTVLTNLDTLETLTLTKPLTAGDVFVLRQDGGIVTAELTREGLTSNAISWLGEDSTLFKLRPGDNLIALTDSVGGINIVGQIEYAEEAVSVYEA